MRLSDIKGERALDVMADAMELADMMADDERVKAFLDAVREKGEEESSVRLLMRHLPPVIRDERYRPRIMSILAAASGMEPEEYAEMGNPVADIVGLLTDNEATGFFGFTAATPE